jgi:hypothetical protein
VSVRFASTKSFFARLRAVHRATYLATVDSKSLDPKQIASLARTVKKYEHFLACLTGRMHQMHFPHDDPLRIAAERAQAGAKELLDALTALERSRQPDISMARQIRKLRKCIHFGVEGHARRALCPSQNKAGIYSGKCSTEAVAA